MSFKLALGAIVAVAAGLFLLPGLVSADGNVTANYGTDCGDGTFSVSLDFHGTTNGGDQHNTYIDVEFENYDDVDVPDGMTASGTGENEYAAVGGDDYWDFEGNDDYEGFFTLNGTYDSILPLTGNPSPDVDVEWEIVNSPNDGGIEISAGPDGDADPDNDWERCVIDYCSNGDSLSDYSFQASDITADCGFINACINGEVERIQEHDANEAGIEEGVCDFEDPPEITTTSTEEDVEAAVETVEPEEEAVAEVSPAVDVAALPSAGYGDAGVNYAWVALLALTLAGFGGATALMVRSRK